MFGPVYQCVIEQFSFSVFNRWGEKVFSTQDKATGWDGQFKGRPAISDVYIWHLQYTGFHRGQLFSNELSGDVTLIR